MLAPTNLSPVNRAVLSALALLAGAAMLALIALFALLFSAGRTVAAGEQAAMYAAGVDLVIGLVATIAYWTLNPGLNVLPRVLTSALFAILQTLLLGVLFVFTLVLLNR